MHPNNPYRQPYPLAEYAKAVPNLKPFLISQYGKLTVDFTSAKAVEALNSAILKVDFGIHDWSLPNGQLCPPVPGRLDYLLHIKDLIGPSLNRPAQIIDVGTGANIIYALLAASHFNWKTVGIEVNRSSITHAQKILAANDKLNDLVELRQQKEANRIFKGVLDDQQQFDVSICNPPFYTSDIEANQLNQQKNTALMQNAKGRNFGGHSHELVYPGGEVAFIKKMIFESHRYRNNVRWFTSLVSQKSSVNAIKLCLKKERLAEVKWIKMEQGNKISRVVAWRY